MSELTLNMSRMTRDYLFSCLGHLIIHMEGNQSEFLLFNTHTSVFHVVLSLNCEKHNHKTEDIKLKLK